MRKLFQTFVVLIFFQKATIQVDQEAKAYCFKDASHYRMQFELLKNDDNVESIYGLSVDDPTVEIVETCSNVFEYSPQEFTGDGTDGDPYTIVVNIIDTVADNECGQQGTGDTYKWLFRTGSAVLLQKPSDKIFSVTCEFGEISDNLAATADVIVTGDISETVIAPISESISLYLVNENGDIITNPALGLPAKLQLELVENEGAKGVYPYTCDVSDTIDFSGSVYSLTDANGCTTTTLLADGFTGVNTAGSVSQTGLFDVFTFHKTATIYYKCRVGYCYEDSDGRCADLCLYNGESDITRRKRRSLDDKPVTIVTSYVVTNLKKHGLSSNRGLANWGCITNVGVIVGYCVLGVIVIASTLSSLYMFYKLKSLHFTKATSIS